MNERIYSRVQTRSGTVERTGVSLAQIAQELGVSNYSLYKWRTTSTSCGRKRARVDGELAFPGNGKVALTTEQQENVRLKRELGRVKQERDILKKAVGFFVRENR